MSPLPVEVKIARQRAAPNRLVIPQHQLRNADTPEGRIASQISLGRTGRAAMLATTIPFAGMEAAGTALMPELMPVIRNAGYGAAGAMLLGGGAAAKVVGGRAVALGHHQLDRFLKSPESAPLKERLGKDHAFVVKTPRGLMVTNKLRMGGAFGYGRVELNPELVDRLGYRKTYDRIAARRAAIARKIEAKDERARLAKRAAFEKSLAKQEGGLWSQPKLRRRV